MIGVITGGDQAFICLNAPAAGGQKGKGQAPPAMQHMRNWRVALSVTHPGRYFDSSIERNIQAVFS
ncbi:hypothetical protein ALQ74_101639 [Pseudomonas savastanoi pv. glycinea]|uniref:Uncharacterized protein n=1 Tax=Pseudomonas savastanoi pv. glycinea TaxID=318 RepID=A0A3M3G5X5_PSESG|nr:hypothetical protein ALQ74_101639 [Pseudomonas savastanoi pv. glycinea]